MNVRIECNKEDYEKVKKMFEKNGFEICDDAKYLFIEVGYKSENMIAFNSIGEKHIIKMNEVILIETDGHKNVVKTTDKSALFVSHKLYYYESEQYNHTLTRVNKSQVINYKNVKKVSVLVNSRLKLTMINNDTVYVTRTYIKNFKNLFN